jgi:phosphonate transport system substrate-binding protein
MLPRPLRFVTFLAPHLLPLYAFVARQVQDRLAYPTELIVGTSYEQLSEEAEVAFVCGLAYIELADQGRAELEPVAAPLLRGERYAGKPVSFSDVIVHRDSPFRSFADLRGTSWCFNEPYSHSGYGVTRHHLLQLGETNGFFGKVVEAGWHERSIQLVASGEVDASAIDSQVLEATLRDQSELRVQLRVIASLGPSTIQPVVVSRRLPDRLKEELRRVLLELGDDPVARECLGRGSVERFVRVADGNYQDVREMRDACAAANFLTLR